ncbi:transposase [Actinoalloteichus spitiensis]|uniref:transposase n=1 Tax=Actinoalloteichus spitiensis TaxID=252394 RepID=UPI001B7F9849
MGSDLGCHAWPDRKEGAPFADARLMVEAVIYRYRCGIAWRDLPEVFGPWQTVWQWHKRLADDGTWDLVQRRLHEHGACQVFCVSGSELVVRGRG